MTYILKKINWFAMMVAFTIYCGNDAKSAPMGGTTRAAPLNVAQAEFVKGNWNTAAVYYRKHLKILPSDYTAWNQLALSYYNAGLLKESLSTLRKVEKSTPDKSFNYFLQGMCLASLGSEPEAVNYWQYAANWSDEYGAKATIELGISAARDGDNSRAKQAFQTYIQKFPKGPDIAAAREYLKTLNEGKKLDGVKGYERPDPEAGLYKYHPWSLFTVPHFWEIRTGIESVESLGYQPGPLEGGNRYGTIENRAELNSDVYLIASIGVGPIKKNNNTSFAGYTYQQNWLTQPESLPNWFADGLSFESFPLRGDLMKRTHYVYGDFRRQATTNLFMGAYGRLSFSRIGSSFFPSPDDNSLRIVTPDVDTQLFIPWMGWSWNSTNRSMFSLYLRKELHNQSPEHSNKTFDFTSGSPAVSFTLSHGLDFPTQRISLNFDLFQYEFVYNDLWLDYTRQGALITTDYSIYKGIGASLILGYYQDGYKLPFIKTGSCDNSSTEEKPAPVTCKRNDTGNMIQVELYYERSQNLKFSASYLMVENSSNQKVYSESSNTIRAGITWAFPGTRRVTRMTTRFADAAFTKDTEQ